jgi:hypothetical protein
MPRFRPHKMYPGALLAQECCSYQASTQLLMRMKGRMAVIVHSDRDCSNVLPKTGGFLQSEDGYRFLCTNMKEDELVTGQGNAKLRRAIELVHEAQQPELIIVLSTCPTVMIGDNVKNVVRKAGKDLGVNAVAEMTNGLKPKSPAEVVDNLYTLLCRGARPPAAGLELERRVNLVGVDLAPRERSEIEAGLQALGLTLNVVLNESASLDQFLAVADAKWNLHPGPYMMLEFDEQCRSKHNQVPIEVPLPFGVEATDRFYATIAAATGVAAQAGEGRLTQVRDAARTAIDTYRERLHARVQRERQRRPRCAFNIGSFRSFDLRRLANEEMGEMPWLDELDFDRALFIQGPQDAANRERTKQVLAELGIDTPFSMFPDPGSLAKYITPGEYDVFIGADFLADQLSKLNLPLLDKSRLGLGYAAVRTNLDLLDAAMNQSFYRHFEPAQDITGPVE